MPPLPKNTILQLGFCRVMYAWSTYYVPNLFLFTFLLTFLNYLTGILLTQMYDTVAYFWAVVLEINTQSDLSSKPFNLYHLPYLIPHTQDTNIDYVSWGIESDYNHFWAIEDCTVTDTPKPEQIHAELGCPIRSEATLILLLSFKHLFLRRKLYQRMWPPSRWSNSCRPWMVISFLVLNLSYTTKHMTAIILSWKVNHMTHAW